MLVFSFVSSLSSSSIASSRSGSMSSLACPRVTSGFSLSSEAFNVSVEGAGCGGGVMLDMRSARICKVSAHVLTLTKLTAADTIKVGSGLLASWSIRFSSGSERLTVRSR